MPLLLKPNLLELSTLAKRWKDRHPSRDPSQISLEERRQCKDARAAFFWKTRQEPLPGAPEASCCSACGLATHGWCEGCYARLGPALDQSYGAICSNCEISHLVCDRCIQSNINWSQGHAAFLQPTPIPTTRTQDPYDPANTIVISGINGEPVNASSINLEELATASGLSAQDLLRQIQEALQYADTSEWTI